MKRLDHLNTDGRFMLPPKMTLFGFVTLMCAAFNDSANGQFLGST